MKKPTRGETATEVAALERAVDRVRPVLQRALEDMPSLAHHPGAKEVAVLSVAARGQAFAFRPVMEALDYLSRHPIDWSREFLVAHDLKPGFQDVPSFSWRSAPTRKYESLRDFYERELAPVWGRWDDLKATYARVLQGEITEAEGERIVLRPKAGRPPKDENADKISDSIRIKRNEHGTSRKATLARLDRDRPDLAARVRAGTMSANAAAIEAGFRKKRARPKATAFAKLKKQIAKALAELTDEERRDLAAMLAPRPQAITSRMGTIGDLFSPRRGS